MSNATTSTPKDKIKIVLLEGIHPSAVELFEKDGYKNIFTAAKLKLYIINQKSKNSIWIK